MGLRTLKRTAVALAVLLIALLVALGLYSETILRAVLERELAARVVPVLRLDGPVRLRVHPELALTVHDIVLSDRAGDVLLVVPETRLVVDRDAFFRGQIVLDTVQISGLDLRLRRDDEVIWRRDGWLHPTDPSAQAGALQVGQLSVRDATIRIEDDISLQVSGLQLEAGPLALDQPARFALEMALERAAPEALARGQVTLAGDFVLADHGLVATDLAMALDGSSGSYASIRADMTVRRVDLPADEAMRFDDVALHLAVAGAQRSVEARASIEALHRAGTTWEAANTRLDAQAHVDDWTLSAGLSAPQVLLEPGSLDVPSITLVSAADGPMSATLDAIAALTLEVDGAASALRVSAAHGQLTLPHPAGGDVPLAIDYDGDSNWSFVSGSGDGRISGRFDRTRFDGHWRYALAAMPPLSLSLALDRLDLDDYMPPPVRDAAPADLTMWRNWPVHAELSVGELRLQGFVSRDARLSLRGHQ